MDVARQELQPSASGTVPVRVSLSIYYELHKLVDAQPGGPVERFVCIMGFAAASAAWYPLMLELRKDWSKRGMAAEVLLLDNIGIGKSSVPENPKLYTTADMARDALAVADHVGWKKFHVIGFSMGGMISTKLAAIAPERVLSLVPISVTGGGMQVVPRRWKGWKYAFMGIRAKSVEARARVDVKFHFSKLMRKRVVPSVGRSMAELLHDEYCRETRLCGMQAPAGQKGQTHAVWHHSVTDMDVKSIMSGGFPVWYLHGRADVLATPRFAEALAKRFNAPCVFVSGGHFIPRENAAEICGLLAVVVDEARRDEWKGGRVMHVSLQVGAGRAAGASEGRAAERANESQPLALQAA